MMAHLCEKHIKFTGLKVLNLHRNHENHMINKFKGASPFS